MFGLRVINGAGLQGGPLNNCPLRTRKSYYPLPPGCDTVALHFGWSGGVSGSGQGQGAVPLDESNYTPGTEPLDIAIYKCRDDQVRNVLTQSADWQIEYLEFVRVLTPQERDIAHARRHEYADSIKPRNDGRPLNLAHTNTVADQIAGAALEHLNSCPAYATRFLRGLRESVASVLSNLYLQNVGGFRALDFLTRTKQGDSIRA